MPRARRLGGAAAAILATWLLVACGGGEPGARPATAQAAPQATYAGSHAISPAAPASATAPEAFRLLTQATFGATPAEMARVMAIGPKTWVDEQLRMSPRLVHRQRWVEFNSAEAPVGPPPGAYNLPVISSFYQEALTAPDQLRQRVAFALSQIFVVSMVDLTGGESEAAASYMDMLLTHAFGNYRDLLEAVTLHPAMGLYLSTVHNRKENLRSGRVPDQNYAREVMQLFSIGVVKLDLDGKAQVDEFGEPVESYGPSDVEGLSRVFTGFSWGGEVVPPRTIAARNMWKPMQPYPQYHSTSKKAFLDAVVWPQDEPDPDKSLKTALNRIALHPNVGPFLARRLIQRLVTSDPSKGYVERVAKVFNDNGEGVRGDLKAVVRAIMLDKEARDPLIAAEPAYGKLREPVLRFTAFLRAYNPVSQSGKYLISTSDDPGTELGQSPLRAPSVFNFYRAGFVPTDGLAAERRMTVPEMQITSEISVAGYANFMADVVLKGAGWRGLDRQAPQRDMQFDISEEVAMAPDAPAMVERVMTRLIGPTINPTLKAHIVEAVESIVVPKPDRGPAALERAMKFRVRIAQTIAVASPDYIVQR